MTGKKIWAGASITKRQDGRVVRINAPSPTGKASLTQRQIARWPHAVRGTDLAAAGKRVRYLLQKGIAVVRAKRSSREHDGVELVVGKTKGRHR